MAYVFIYQHFLLVEATLLNNSAPIITGWVYHDYPRQTMPSLEWARLSTVLTEFAFILSAALTFPCAAWLLHLLIALHAIIHRHTVVHLGTIHALHAVVHRHSVHALHTVVHRHSVHALHAVVHRHSVHTLHAVVH